MASLSGQIMSLLFDSGGTERAGKDASSGTPWGAARVPLHSTRRGIPRRDLSLKGIMFSTATSSDVQALKNDN